MPVTSRRKKGEGLARLAAGSFGAEARANKKKSATLTQQQQDLLYHWSLHPYNFLTGVDTDGETPILWTKDEGDLFQSVKPFPRDKPHLKEYLNDLLFHRVVFIEKSRQMMASTGVLLFALWDILFHRARRWVLSKSTEDEAEEMLRDKVRFPHSTLPEWVRKAHPISPRPMKEVKSLLTDSYILGGAQNVATAEARGGTASAVIVDEAAFQDEFEEIVGAVLPMASRLYALTTPNLDIGGRAFLKYIDKAIQ